MLTFSVAQQSIVEPDTGIAFQFIPDVDGDTSKNILRLTRVDADPIEMHFDRNGRYLRTEYVTPMDDDDLKARDDMRSANADAAQASYALHAPLPAGAGKEVRDQRQQDYDRAIEAQQKAQETYNERERARIEKSRARGQVGDKVLPMTPPQPGLNQIAPESAPRPQDQQPPSADNPHGVVNTQQGLSTRDLQKMQANQSPDTISRTYEPASPDHFDPKGLPQYQPPNPQLPPNAQRPDSLKDKNDQSIRPDGQPQRPADSQPTAAAADNSYTDQLPDSRPQTTRPPKEAPANA